MTGPAAHCGDVGDVGLARSEALNALICARINNIDVEGNARRTMQNRSHSADENEINPCCDQRRNDLLEINGDRSFVSTYCRRVAILQPFATHVNAF